MIGNAIAGEFGGWNLPNIEDELKRELAARAVPDALIDAILDSGYWLRHWVNPFNRQTWTSVSDMMYGSKEQSSNFQIDKFIEYAKGNYRFDALPPFRRYKVKSRADIDNLLLEQPRPQFVEAGALSFRGQPREHTFKRRIPNPLRSDTAGAEISVMAGAFRQKTPFIHSRSRSPRNDPFRGSCRIWSRTARTT